jgi:hypothetical protein
VVLEGAGLGRGEQDGIGRVAHEGADLARHRRRAPLETGRDRAAAPRGGDGEHGGDGEGGGGDSAPPPRSQEPRQPVGGEARPQSADRQEGQVVVVVGGVVVREHEAVRHVARHQAAEHGPATPPPEGQPAGHGDGDQRPGHHGVERVAPGPPEVGVAEQPGHDPPAHLALEEAEHDQAEELPQGGGREHGCRVREERSPPRPHPGAVRGEVEGGEDGHDEEGGDRLHQHGERARAGGHRQPPPARRLGGGHRRQRGAQDRRHHQRFGLEAAARLHAVGQQHEHGGAEDAGGGRRQPPKKLEDQHGRDHPQGDARQPGDPEPLAPGHPVQHGGGRLHDRRLDLLGRGLADRPVLFGGEVAAQAQVVGARQQGGVVLAGGVEGERWVGEAREADGHARGQHDGQQRQHGQAPARPWRPGPLRPSAAVGRSAVRRAASRHAPLCLRRPRRSGGAPHPAPPGPTRPRA